MEGETGKQRVRGRQWLRGATIEIIIIGKWKEIQGNSGKFREKLGNGGKFREIEGNGVNEGKWREMEGNGGEFIMGVLFVVGQKVGLGIA